MKKKTKLLLAPDTLFLKTPDGKYWSDTIYSYDFFQRYLTVFDEIIIASRTKIASYDEVKGFLRSDGPYIEVRELPAMQGMRAYLKKIISFSKSAKAACEGVDCGMIRLPSVSASMVLHYFKKKKLPYALEIVADPHDAYATNLLAKRLFTLHLKKACLQANGVSYVTKYYLQSKYPAYARIHCEDDQHFESYYSTIRISDNYFTEARNFDGKKHFNIIHTANNMNNDLKGHEVVIRAAKKVIDDGYDISVIFVGDGAKRTEFETMVKKLEISDKVTFTGMLSSAQMVREKLLEADLFVFPTKAEGLPRSIIEAMVVGLPCISTPIAGIPELLEEEDMIDPSDIDAFTKRIEEFISNTSLMNQKSERNVVVARNYRENILRERRDAYYNKLKQLIK